LSSGVRTSRIVTAAACLGIVCVVVPAAGTERDHLVAGDAAYSRSDLSGARAAYLSAVHAAPRPYEALCRLSRVEADLAADERGEAQRQLIASAAEHANAAIRVFPDSALGHLVLAEALVRQSDHEGPRTRLALAREIKAEVDRALTADPRLARAYRVRGIWNRAMATRGFWDRAMGRTVLGGQPRGASLANSAQDLEKAVELEPRDIGNRLELARTYAKMKRREDARKQLAIALAIPPGGSPFDTAWLGQARGLREKLR
jgi:tetratricopeptide (TPR) repeat protein